MWDNGFIGQEIHTEMYACVCVCMCACMRQSPLTLMLLPPPAPPTRCRGMMPHPPGACCPRAVCWSSLSASLCGWLVGWLSEGVSMCERVSVLYPNPQPLVYPQLKASSSSQHQHPNPPTRPWPASWLCGILATANGVPMESPCREAWGLDNRILSNEDDGNDFTLSLPSPSAWILIFFFRMHRPSKIR